MCADVRSRPTEVGRHQKSTRQATPGRTGPHPVHRPRFTPPISPSHLHLSSMTPLPLTPLLAPLALPLLAPLTPAVLSPFAPPLPDAVWPLDPRPRIVHPYAPPAKPWLPGHRGIDLAGTPGQQVRSATPGTITYAGPVAGRSVVVVTHGPQRTTYEPVIPSLPTGTAVHAAQPIGHLSAATSHCAPTTCLHWGLLEGKTYLNPLSLLPAQPVRLLPTAPTPDRRLPTASLPDRRLPTAPTPDRALPTAPPQDHPVTPPLGRVTHPTPLAHRLLGQHPTTLLPAQRPQPQATCPPACRPPQPPTRAADHSPLPTVVVTLSALATLGATLLIRNH